MPKFSIILATRDRPGLFSEALESVMGQTCQDFDIVVVNDGSAPDHQDVYERIYAAARERIGDRFRSHRLIRRPRGHGQSYSINYGVDQASGDYVCFLDDDDFWTDRDHLARASAALAAHGDVGSYMANQRAFMGDQQVSGPVWLETLEGELLARGKRPNAQGIFSIDLDDLMRTQGFCHMNCLIVSKPLFKTIGGMDEGIRWECDRDLFLRLIDRAGSMIFSPAFISHHRVPDPTKSQNMTTAISMLEKRLLQIRVLDKAALFATHAQIHSHARKHKAYALKKIAEESAGSQNWRTAASYAKEALAIQPTTKWMLFTLYCGMRAMF